MRRDLTEIVKSQQKMLKRDPGNFPVYLIDTYVRHLNNVEIWKEREPGVEMINIDYHDVLEKPELIMEELQAFIGLKLDTKNMVTAIDEKLYRTRNNVQS